MWGLESNPYSIWISEYSEAASLLKPLAAESNPAVASVASVYVAPVLGVSLELEPLSVPVNLSKAPKGPKVSGVSGVSSVGPVPSQS
jgi:hypothetical protein